MFERVLGSELDPNPTLNLTLRALKRIRGQTSVRLHMSRLSQSLVDDPRTSACSSARGTSGELRQRAASAPGCGEDAAWTRTRVGVERLALWLLLSLTLLLSSTYTLSQQQLPAVFGWDGVRGRS